MYRMQVYLPEELFLSLKNQATERTISMSEIIRRGLKKVLPSQRSESKDLAGFVGRLQAKKKTNAVAEINNYYQLSK